jgi:DNA helicase-2/ATP-dependent DNA helicase PcrA
MIINSDADTTKNNHFVLGFYGDFMQQIYDKGIGIIDSESNRLVHITKSTNFRSSKNVIDFLNKIRTDICQYPAGENRTIEGNVMFVYADCNKHNIKDSVLKVKTYFNSYWSTSLKILFLTHREIAYNAGFMGLSEVYTYYPYYSRSNMLYEKECPLIHFLVQRIEMCVQLYLNNDIPLLLEKIDFNISYKHDILELKQIMDGLLDLRSNSKVKEIWDYVFRKNLFLEDDKIVELLEKSENNPELNSFINNLLNLEYKEIINFYEYNEEESNLITQHGTKGTEFDSTLVIIGERSWNNYDFPAFLSFSDETMKESVRRRTRNLLYVSSSRSIKNLAFIYINNVESLDFQKLNSWFGSDNVVPIDDLNIGEIKNIY